MDDYRFVECALFCTAWHEGAALSDICISVGSAVGCSRGSRPYRVDLAHAPVRIRMEMRRWLLHMMDAMKILSATPVHEKFAEGEEIERRGKEGAIGDTGRRERRGFGVPGADRGSGSAKRAAMRTTRGRLLGAHKLL